MKKVFGEEDMEAFQKKCDVFVMTLASSREPAPPTPPKRRGGRQPKPPQDDGLTPEDSVRAYLACCEDVHQTKERLAQERSTYDEMRRGTFHACEVHRPDVVRQMGVVDHLQAEVDRLKGARDHVWRMFLENPGDWAYWHTLDMNNYEAINAVRRNQRRNRQRLREAEHQAALRNHSPSAMRELELAQRNHQKLHREERDIQARTKVIAKGKELQGWKDAPNPREEEY